MIKQLLIIIFFIEIFDLKSQNKPIITSPINSGYVFVDGKLIEPPYSIKLKNKDIYINNIKVEELRFPTCGSEKVINYLPELPVELQSSSTIDDIININEKYLGRNFLDAVLCFFFSHFERDEGTIYLNYYLKFFPNLKKSNYRDGWLYLEDNNGVNKTFSVFQNEYNYSRIFGPSGTGIPKDFIGEKWLNRKVKFYERFIEEGSLIIISNFSIIRDWNASKSLSVLGYILEIDTTFETIETKATQLIKKEVFIKGQEKEAEYFIRKLHISNELRHKIIDEISKNFFYELTRKQQKKDIKGKIEKIVKNNKQISTSFIGTSTIFNIKECGWEWEYEDGSKDYTSTEGYKNNQFYTESPHIFDSPGIYRISLKTNGDEIRIRTKDNVVIDEAVHPKLEVYCKGISIKEDTVNKIIVTGEIINGYQADTYYKFYFQITDAYYGNWIYNESIETDSYKITIEIPDNYYTSKIQLNVFDMRDYNNYGSCYSIYDCK